MVFPNTSLLKQLLRAKTFPPSKCKMKCMVVHTFSFWREPRQICFQHFREFCSAELELKKKNDFIAPGCLGSGHWFRYLHRILFCAEGGCNTGTESQAEKKRSSYFDMVIWLSPALWLLLSIWPKIFQYLVTMQVSTQDLDSWINNPTHLFKKANAHLWCR